MSERRKPRGESGSVSVSRSGALYHQLELPATKEGIENWMLERALRAAEASGAGPYHLKGPPVRNPENDLDFTLPTQAGDEYLDLMEIAILPKGARGYRDAPTGYHPEERARDVFSMVKKKTRKYGRPRSKIHLLLYITDRRFELVPSVVEHLVLTLSRKPHGFASVCYFAADTEDEGLFVRLYPPDASILATYEERDWGRRQTTRRTWVMRGDLSTATFAGRPIPRSPRSGADRD